MDLSILSENEYAEAFHTFRRLSNEGQQQNKCLNIFAKDVECLFPKKTHLFALELGCGSAAKGLALRDFFAKDGIILNYKGIDNNESLLDEARLIMPEAIFEKRNIFESLDYTFLVDLALGIHTGYYAKNNEDYEIYLDNLEKIIDENSIILLMHKSEHESTNAFKQRYSLNVESQTTHVLSHHLKERNMDQYSFEFNGEIFVPFFSFKDHLLPSLDTIQLINFLTHRHIDRLTTQKRNEILYAFETLCNQFPCHNNFFVLPTYTEFSLINHRKADSEFKQKTAEVLLKIADDMKDKNKNLS